MAQVLVAGFLLFDRSLTLPQGIAMISLALGCIFLRKLTRTMIRKNGSNYRNGANQPSNTNFVYLIFIKRLYNSQYLHTKFCHHLHILNY